MTIGLKSELQFQAENVKFPKAEGYGARIGDMWVRLAVGPDRPLRYYTKDSLAPRQDFRGATTENVLDIGYTWGRTELNGGEGLDWDPRELSGDEAQAARDVRRFWDSKNIALDAPPAGQPYTARLSHTLEAWNSVAHSEVNDIGASSSHVFVANATDVWVYTSWTDGTPTTIPIGAVTKMLAVSAGDEVVVIDVDGNAHYRETDGSGFTQIYEAGVDGDPIYASWFVKGRFVAFRRDGAGQNGELGELYQDGTFVEFDTVGEQIVVAVVSTGPSIVAGVTDGTVRSYVPEQANQADPSSVNLVVRGRTDMPKGEIPAVLGATAGVLTILTISENADTLGTTARFYRGEALSSQYDYTIGGLQLLREWFNTGEEVEVRANMTSTRDAIWFAVTESDGISYLWRFDLTTFGLVRTSETFTGVGYATTLFDGEGALLHDTDGVIYLTTDTYQSYGYLISPNVTFGLNTDIAWISSILEAHDLSSFSSVELLRTTDPEGILDPEHTSWVVMQRLSQPSQSGAEIDILNTNSRTLALQIRMYSDGVETAKVTRTATRGIPTHRDWMVLIPVNVSDMVEVPGRMPIKIPTLGDGLQRDLLNLTGKHVELVVVDPPMLFRGVVDNVEEPVTYISDRGSSSVYCQVQFRGQRATATIQAIGNAGMGLGLLGVATIGIGQEIE